jgi:hypothetical protein
MKYLPLVMSRGPPLAEAMRGAAQDPRRRIPCGCCGARIQIASEQVGQAVRCPDCVRWQRIIPEEETPWRLTQDRAEALRRTRSWLRRL